MRRMIFCILVLILIPLCIPAPAQAADETQIADALAHAGITQPLQLSQWGGTAVCLAETDGIRQLIVLENQDGAWRITVSNPTALIQDFDWPRIYLDSDQALFWTYTLSDQETVRYHCSRNPDGSWGAVDQFFGDSSFGAYTHIWNTSWDGARGEIIRSFSVADENDNMIGGEIIQYLPASWLSDCILLEDFDVSRFPTMFLAYSDFFALENARFFREAAASLMPEYTFIKGMLKNGAMHFLMQKPDGSRVYAVCEYARGRQVNLIESSPLPPDTVLGWENFTDSLYIDGRCVTVQLLQSGTAGLEYIYDDAAYSEETGGFLFFGDRTVWDGSEIPAATMLYGDHPWSDITQIDWNTLPHSLSQAGARMDSSRFAMVVNPNPADRLHLRERADRGSRSQGKYYTGTPVTVSAKSGDWTQVVFGDERSRVHGYMMSRFLTFGPSSGALALDLTAMPQLSSESIMLKVFEGPQDGASAYRLNTDTMKVIGIIGDAWYHVWFPATGEYGFVRQSDLTEGNG